MHHDSKERRQDGEAEQAIVGSLLTGAVAWEQIADQVEPDHFHDPRHAQMVGLIRDLADENGPIDRVTVTHRLKQSRVLAKLAGDAFLDGLVASACAPDHVGAHVAIVVEHAQARQVRHILLESAQKLQLMNRTATDVLVDAVDRLQRLTDAADAADEPRIGLEPVATVVDRVAAAIAQAMESDGELPGASTGIVDLDEKLAGLQDGHLVILAARPSMGKTALALQIAEIVARASGAAAGLPVLFFSLEQQAEELVMRLLSRLADIDHDLLRRGRLGNADWERLRTKAADIRGLPLQIDSTPALTASAVRTRADRAARAAGGLALVVVDYMQLMESTHGRRENRNVELTEISRGLRAIAKDMSCPVIALSQLNRNLESRNNKRPRMSDLRESGAIEQDADVILFVHREEVYDPDNLEKRGLAELIIGKQRNGPLGTVTLSFDGAKMRFADLDDKGRGPLPGDGPPEARWRPELDRVDRTAAGSLEEILGT